MPDDKNVQYRYPGTKPFEAEEHALFKGRDDDVQKLSEIISLQSLVVLFGRSGLGKSSLLNAGLVNRFRNHPGIVPLFVRFGAYHNKNTASPLDRLQQALAAQGGQTAPSNFIYEKLIAKEDIAPHHLWYFFKSHQIARPQGETIVLVFDQFEELFTYPEAEINRLKKELSELLYVSVPQQLRNLLKDKLRLDAAYLNEEEKEALFRPLNVKALFSIRSDKLSLLNNFTDCFPAVLQHCYELKPLTKEQARQAIEEPARLDDKKYASPPFLFTAEAGTVLLNALTEARRGKDGPTIDHHPEIETFQLQIVCRHAENIVIEKGLRQITAADLGDIKAVFENHYRNIIDKFPPAQRLPAQRLMEEKLIIDGNRVSMPVPFILRDEGMTGELLDELINTHLLRREQANTVEISHDTLVEPILKQYEERRKAEAVIKELREKEEEIEKIRKEQQEQAWMQSQKAKRNRALMTVISVAMLFMMALAGYAFKQSRNALEQNAIAEKQKHRAESNEAEAKKEKEKALSNERKADSLRQIAVKSDSAARAALEEAKFQRAKAESNAKEAVRLTVEARQERANTERQKEAFRLVLVAHEKENEDPVVALRIAEAAMQKFNDPLIVNEAKHIYLEHDFYKTVGGQDQATFGALAPDGTAVLLPRYSGVVLTTTRGEEKKEFRTTLEREISRARSVVFSPADKKTFLIGLEDGTVELWNSDSVRIHQYKRHAGATESVAFSGVESIAFSADGSEFLSGFKDGTAILWSINGDSLMRFNGQKGAVASLAFTGDKKRILTGSWDSTVRLWDRSSALFQETKEAFPVTALAFSADETNVFIGGTSPSEEGDEKEGVYGTVELWHPKDDSKQQLINKKAGIYSISFSPDGTKIITGSDNGTVDLLNENGGVLKELKAHNDWVALVAFASKGGTLLTGSNKDSVKLWTINEFPVKKFEKHTNHVNLAVFSGDGSKFLTGSDDSTAVLWSTEGGLLKVLKKHSGAVSSVDLSRDGELLLTASTDGTAMLWNANGDSLRRFKGHTDALQSVALSKDKTKVLTGSDDGTAVLWTIAGDSLLTLKGHEDGITSVAFSPDGTRLLTGSRDGTAKLWNVKGDSLHTFRGHGSGVNAIAFSEGGTRILTGSDDGTAILWSTGGERLMTFKGHSGAVLSVAFAPDSTRILTGSVDATARVWNANGELIRMLKGYEDAVSCAVFSPDGSRILTTSWDKTVKLWNSGRLLTLEQFLKSDATDRLTQEQKQKAGIQ